MTANDGASYEYFVWNFAIGGDTLLVGYKGKDYDRLCPAYAFIL